MSKDKSVIVTVTLSMDNLIAALERVTESFERLDVTLHGCSSPAWWKHFSRDLRRRTQLRLASAVL